MIPNLYPAIVEKEDADSIRLGKWKTGLYFLVVLAAVAGVALFNGTRSIVISEKVGSHAAPITVTQYDTIKGKNPSCPCTKSVIALEDFIDVDLKVDELCDVRLPEEELPPHLPDAGIDSKTPVVGVNRLCDLAVSQAAAKTTTIKKSQMANPNALSPSSLNETVRVLVQNTIRNVKSDYNLVMTTKSLFDTMQRPYLMTEWGLESKRVSEPKVLVSLTKAVVSETEWTAGWVTELTPKLHTGTKDLKTTLNGTNGYIPGYSRDDLFALRSAVDRQPDDDSYGRADNGQPGCSADWNAKMVADLMTEDELKAMAAASPDSKRCGTGSNIFKKMLAKTSAEREQTVFGLTCDALQRTLNMQTAYYAECETIEIMYTGSKKEGSTFLIKDGIVPKVKPGAYHTVRDAANNAFLDPSAGVRKIHFDKYFTTCAPTTCTYTELRPPSIGELVLLTLALVGGLNGLIKLGVGIFVDAIQAMRRKCNGDAETDPEAPPGKAAVLPVNRAAAVDNV